MIHSGDINIASGDVIRDPQRRIRYIVVGYYGQVVRMTNMDDPMNNATNIPERDLLQLLKEGHLILD